MSTSRRRFLVRSLVLGGFGAGLARSAWGMPWLKEGITPTAAQTTGPFYPIPEIEKQKHYDADLTRLDEKSPVADGDQIVVRGSVVNFDDRPLSQVIVEVWQACTTGRYNHPQDRNDRPIDPNFQYWARILTAEDGSFSFRTIQPGKYPGRTPHIHYRIVAKDHPELVTQMYFESNEEFNRRDGIYMDLSPEQRKSVTVAMESKPLDVTNPQSEKLPTGNFKIVLGPLSDAKATRPM